MVAAGLSRTTINGRVNRIRRMFKWAVENEFVPATTLHGLQAVPPLKRGRCQVREAPEVTPVPDEHIEAVRPHVAPQIWAMIQLQRLTGMRPGEVVAMKAGDLDTTGQLWIYRPSRHKTEHFERQRVVYMGSQAQAVLRPFLKTDLSAHLFSPADVVEAKNRQRREERRSPMTPSQARRTRKRHPKRQPGAAYTPNTYAVAVRRACQIAGVPPWSPNRLRHTVATRLRKQFGIEAARVARPRIRLDHGDLCGADQLKAAEVMSRVG